MRSERYSLPSWLTGARRLPSQEALKDEVAAAQRGDVRARERVILATVRWCLKRALYWTRFGGKCHADDLVSEGMNGVSRAIDLYDRNAGTSFLTYATHWIDQAMRRRVWYEASAVVDKAAVRNGAGKRIADVSLDAPANPEDGAAARIEFMPAPHDTFEIVSGSEERRRAARVIAKFSERISERHRTVLRHRFLEEDPATLEQVAKLVFKRNGQHVTREYVRLIENDVLEHLARYLGMPRPANEIKANLRMMEAA